VLVALLATFAVACEPFDGFKTTRISRGANTVTEYFAGAYRVTQCDSTGRPRKSTTMARIATPTGAEPFVPIEQQREGTRVFLLYGDPKEKTSRAPPRTRPATRSGSGTPTRART
jgi:hypothetical protein